VSTFQDFISNLVHFLEAVFQLILLLSLRCSPHSFVLEISSATPSMHSPIKKTCKYGFGTKIVQNVGDSVFTTVKKERNGVWFRAFGCTLKLMRTVLKNQHSICVLLVHARHAKESCYENRHLRTHFSFQLCFIAKESAACVYAHICVCECVCMCMWEHCVWLCMTVWLRVCL